MHPFSDIHSMMHTYMSGKEKSAVQSPSNTSVKVKIIITQKVETNMKDFKSVVQRLTGKDSRIDEPALETFQQTPSSSPAPKLTGLFTLDDFFNLWKD